MEYEYQVERSKNSRSIVAYTLGLIGSTLAAIVCFFIGVFTVLVYDLINKGIDIASKIPQVQQNQFLLDTVIKSEGFINSVAWSIAVYFFIIVVGLILGIVSTILCWRKNTVLSSSIMIVSGLILIVCVFFPGIFMLIGAGINLKNAVRNVKSQK